MQRQLGDIMNYEHAWSELKKWVKQEQEDMLVNPNRTDWFESGIASQTAYLKGKMDELEQQIHL